MTANIDKDWLEWFHDGVTIRKVYRNPSWLRTMVIKIQWFLMRHGLLKVVDVGMYDDDWKGVWLSRGDGKSRR